VQYRPRKMRCSRSRSFLFAAVGLWDEPRVTAPLLGDHSLKGGNEVPTGSPLRAPTRCVVKLSLKSVLRFLGINWRSILFPQPPKCFTGVVDQWLSNSRVARFCHITDQEHGEYVVLHENQIYTCLAIQAWSDILPTAQILGPCHFLDYQSLQAAHNSWMRSG
jgi:hypothetical protein